ncbi:hypothetical protein EUX98_g1940 [Antrodiella citrinella]|uniref:triacylglycerol lipase n=1 Tax=Antrodiella citrinella TaxID=2447956 RepID=A0A4S4N2H4_9APHY|nr:hypothetical protein EUX98_g1940 [Antrodiella citrinella]
MFLPSTLLTFLSSLLFTAPTPPLTPPTRGLQFTLRQYHAVTQDARVLFHDLPSAASVVSESFSEPLRTRRVPLHRPRVPDYWRNPNNHVGLKRKGGGIHGGDGYDFNGGGDWEEDEVDAPDVERRETLLALAKMTNNAYLEPDEAGWYDLGGTWNVSYPFGWDTASDGFRGHVFATPDNSTVVLSIKGTSAAFVGGGGPTAKKDKFNDNLLFSCCCARVDWTWTTVCGCYRTGWQCDQGCLEEALVSESLFYPVGTKLYYNISYMYPEANIWLVGHSLGGALASLLGVTFGLPAVAFESPDPIAMGTCNGVLSSCALGGYAMETRCHLGKSIVYDTVTNLGWAVDIRLHGIVNVIERVLGEPWPEAEKAGREVPELKIEDDCVECYSWEFGDYPLPTPKLSSWNRSRLEP